MKLDLNLSLKRNNDFYLDKESYQVLSMLYKPLISSDALNIYLSLYQASLSLTTISPVFLVDIISSDLKLDKIMLKLDTLKEYKLIKYSNTEIELYKPLDKENFKNQNLLVILKNLSSNEELNYILNEVYGTTFEIETKDTTKILSKVKYNESKKNKVPYSFTELTKHIDDISNLYELKDAIDSISTLYNYSLEDILKIIYEVEQDNHIDESLLIDASYNRYKSKQSLNKNIVKDSSDIDFINYFKEYNPEKALAYGGRRISDADKKTLERLKTETTLSDELISLLVIYSLVTNNYKMHAYRFYEVISEDWKNKNIETIDEAYHYINTLYMDNNKKTTKTTKSSEDWFNDMWKSVKEEQNDQL